jgi:dolichol-phosphate mannosyltransferase
MQGDFLSGSLSYPIIAVIIPAYKVEKLIASVLQSIPDCVSRIYVVDDCCPNHSGAVASSTSTTIPLTVLRHAENGGVGAAVITGYRAAIGDGADILIKIDGDGQMNPGLIAHFIAPILNGDSDYSKGNRFYDLENIGIMPPIRIFGNAILSFMTKLSSGYWNIFDPTNGFTAIHSNVARRLPFDKISKRYFFETDMLFRLNLLGAVVIDVPMDARYGQEVSNLKISNIFTEFLHKHIKNFFKRIFYNYFLRDFSLASIELLFGSILFLFGIFYGGYHWYQANEMQINSPVGTVMLPALTTLLGMQLLLGFLAYDIRSTPSKCIHRLLS